MTELHVDTVTRTLDSPIGALACAIGRAGAIDAAAKRESDGATPIGRWPVRGALLRPDRLATPSTALPWRWLRPGDGWSDDILDPSYNRPVMHPHRFRAERLWRADTLYDLIIVFGHNDAPPVAGLGSAIFLHCLPPSGVTAGCVAVAEADLSGLLSLLGPGDAVRIA